MKRLIILTILLLFSLPAFSDSQYLYRFDMRAPNPNTESRSEANWEDLIFRNGFKPPGFERSVLNHLRGISCWQRTRTTGFISMTSDFDPEEITSYAFHRALFYALEEDRRAKLEHRSPRGIYIYQIDPDYNMYEAARTLEYYKSQPGLSSSQIDELEKLIRQAGDSWGGQSEWISDGPVRGNQIVGAYRILAGMTHLTQADFIRNVDYHRLGSGRNPGPFTGVNLSSELAILPNRERIVSTSDSQYTSCASAISWCFDRFSTARKGGSTGLATTNSLCYIEEFKKVPF
ncbi:hypothetical protein ACLBWS_12510 [Brucellaceae bacterium D45D]